MLTTRKSEKSKISSSLICCLRNKSHSRGDTMERNSQCWCALRERVFPWAGERNSRLIPFNRTLRSNYSCNRSLKSPVCRRSPGKCWLCARALNISRFKLKYQHKRSLEQELRGLSLNYRFATVVIESPINLNGEYSQVENFGVVEMLEIFIHGVVLK